MTFRQLEHAIEVADQGSISVAARKLMIAQPSLSQSIKNIEKELNIILFDRSSVPLVPTKAGAIFLNKANIILTALDDMMQEIALMETAVPELLIGISDTAALINRRISQDFQARFPDMKLVMVERDQRILERMLEAGKLDMIFTMVPQENPNIEVIPLLEGGELILALPKSHPVSRRCVEEHPDMFGPDGRQRYFPVVDLAECSDLRYVLSGRDRLKMAQLSVLRTAFEPEIGFETDTLSSGVALAALEPYGTVVTQMYAMLYDGQDRPYFFQCNTKTPTWGFALSLQKNFRLSEAELYYIELFIRYIESLGRHLYNGRSADELMEYLRSTSNRKHPKT